MVEIKEGDEVCIKDINERIIRGIVRKPYGHEKCDLVAED
jgi:hypothetical protein